ncbi:MAG: helix-turn-helix domain-containing protein [Clostridia bacterium]|nr:helix-turn-helix domain-containing protein [Clostridia bacterium]
MLYKRELELLCDFFRKIHVRFATLTAEQIGVDPVYSLHKCLPREFFSPGYIDRLEHTAVYRSTDGFGFSYSYFLLPDVEPTSVMCIGPYLYRAPDNGMILEIGEKNGFSPANQKFLSEYYRSVPVLSRDCHSFVMLATFLERVWGTSSFAIVDVDADKGAPASPITEIREDDGINDITVSMKATENRYAWENEIISAVATGQLHKEEQLVEFFSADFFEKRTADPLRNAKNYGVIMNTLLRKAAEAGGVHPVYLDKMSTDFALRIEQLPSLSENTKLMCEMFRSYCRLVRKHSLNSYSSIVQKSILMIDSDLSLPLSLKILADRLNISAGYLSGIFKKETGKTVSEYIRVKRVKHAMHLLESTGLQVQTVALHCGIVDLQYFSKLFKKETGKTPSEFREEARKRAEAKNA